MTLYTPQNVTPAGLAPTYHSAASGDKVKASRVERDLLHVKNGSEASVTLTIAAQMTSAYQEGAGNLTIPDLTIAVGAGADSHIGPIGAAYIDSDGNYDLSWSATATVTFAAMRLPAVSKSFL